MSVLNELEEKLQSKEKELQRVIKEKEELEIKLKKSEKSKFICIHTVLLVCCNIANMTGPDDEELKRENFDIMLSRVAYAMMEHLEEYKDYNVFRQEEYYLDPWEDNPLIGMKEILRSRSDPTDPSKLLVPLEISDKAKDVKELIYSLVPRYINYRDTRLLRSLVSKTRSYHLYYLDEYEKNPLKKL